MLFSIVHDSGEEFHAIWISQITKLVNQFLEIEKEHFRLTPRKVGSVLTSFGFTDRRRTNEGWTLQLSRQDAERVHQLVARYGLDGFENYISDKQDRACSLCKAAGLDKKSGPTFPSGGGRPNSMRHILNLSGEVGDGSERSERLYGFSEALDRRFPRPACDLA